MVKIKGRKTLILFGVILILLTGCLSSPSKSPDQSEQSPDITTAPTNGQSQQQSTGLSRVGEIHLKRNPKSLSELKGIIKTDSDEYTRERAVFVFGDIAMSEDNTIEAIGFLKDVATSDVDDAVRSAALANIDLIRQQDPFESSNALQVDVKGEIKQGSTITIVLEVSPSQQVNAVAGINDLSRLGDESLTGLRFSDIQPRKFSLGGGSVKEISYDLLLEEAGEYLIGTFLELSLDRIDTMTIEKDLYLKVGKDGGEYKVSGLES